MSQSNYILGTILAGFVIFITTRGELPRYMGFFIGTPTQGTSQTDVTVTSTAAAASQPTPSNAGGTTMSWLDTIGKAAEFAAVVV